MSVLRPALVGLLAGAAVAFLAALLGPRRRRDPVDLDDPPQRVDLGAASERAGSRPAPGAP
jgi:hypothetical protein